MNMTLMKMFYNTSDSLWSPLFPTAYFFLFIHKILNLDAPVITLPSLSPAMFARMRYRLKIKIMPKIGQFLGKPENEENYVGTS